MHHKTRCARMDRWMHGQFNMKMLGPPILGVQHGPLDFFCPPPQVWSQHKKVQKRFDRGTFFQIFILGPYPLEPSVPLSWSYRPLLLGFFAGIIAFQNSKDLYSLTEISLRVLITHQRGVAGRDTQTVHRPTRPSPKKCDSTSAQNGPQS